MKTLSTLRILYRYSCIALIRLAFEVREERNICPKNEYFSVLLRGFYIKHLAFILNGLECSAKLCAKIIAVVVTVHVVVVVGFAFDVVFVVVSVVVVVDAVFGLFFA